MSGQVLEAFVLESEPAPFYLAAHSGCFVLAKHFIRTRAVVRNTFNIGPEDDISSLEQLWEVLYRRMPGDCYHPSETVLPDPFDYYGGKSCQNVEWEPEYGPEISEVGDKLHAAIAARYV